ncbi:GspH/FimT family pseudopilin [Thiolapillus sp.]
MDFTPTRPKGFTLVEVVVTVAVVGILASLAIPAFESIRARNAMAGSVNLFLAQAHLARSTAVTREKHITLCPTQNGSECHADHQSWQGGYLVFEDSNKNQRRDPEEQIVSHQQQAHGGVKIHSSSNHRNRITYRPLGRAWFSNTSVRFCLEGHPELNRVIIISNNGRIRSAKRMADGSPVTCS